MILEEQATIFYLEQSLDKGKQTTRDQGQDPILFLFLITNDPHASSSTAHRRVFVNGLRLILYLA